MIPPRRIARLARSISRRTASPDDDWAARFLLPGERSVYLAMDPRDREHAVRVARRLLRDHPLVSHDLLAAALLHDCGKSVRGYRLWERVLAGLLPQSTRWTFWAPLRVRAQHPQLGAGMLRAAAARPRVTWLVEHHHRPDADPEAALLHRYDDLE